MADMMNFPETIDEFLDSYAFKDKEEVYTNGSVLIPLFRVKQGLEHYVLKLNDEINRQQTKIEALQMDNKQLHSDVINANQNWSHIKGLWECEKEKVESAKQKVICACKMLNTAKSEAIKEFAERLKEKCYEDFQETYEMLSPYVTDDDIDNLVKEMTRSDDE